MINLELLNEKIKQSGLKKQYIADQIGISVQSLNRKLKGLNEITMTEANILAKLLNLNKRDVGRIFFTYKVDKMTTG